MNKQLTANLIITSIFILAMKDSASFVHTMLHYIPNNPWHQHAPLAHKHRINPLEIHKYLQQKNSHAHEHTAHTHTHAHDVMDHIHADDSGHQTSKSESINLSIKIDLFIQSYANFTVARKHILILFKHNSLYSFSRITHSPFPPFQPPQA